MPRPYASSNSASSPRRTASQRLLEPHDPLLQAFLCRGIAASPARPPRLSAMSSSNAASAAAGSRRSATSPPAPRQAWASGRAPAGNPAARIAASREHLRQVGILQVGTRLAESSERDACSACQASIAARSRDIGLPAGRAAAKPPRPRRGCRGCASVMAIRQRACSSRASAGSIGRRSTLTARGAGRSAPVPRPPSAWRAVGGEGSRSRSCCEKAVEQGAAELARRSAVFDGRPTSPRAVGADRPEPSGLTRQWLGCEQVEQGIRQGTRPVEGGTEGRCTVAGG